MTRRASQAAANDAARQPSCGPRASSDAISRQLSRHVRMIAA
jgi:hypothetical protein